jgi:mono/diheme cytochrome c family protein
VATYVLEVGPGIASEGAPPQSRSEAEDNRPSAAQVYRSSCVSCHDSDGRGGPLRDTFPTIPDFTNPLWHDSHTDEALSHSILAGKGRAMRPMKKELGALDVAQMVAFVRVFRGGGVVVRDETEPPAPETDPEAVETRRAAAAAASAGQASTRRAAPATNDSPRVITDLYRRWCVSCHGEDGRGTPARSAWPSIPDFTAPRWQTGRNDARLLVSILDGKGTAMPAWRGRLSIEQARALAAQVRRFAPQDLSGDSTPDSDFTRRFQQLQEQWESLDKQVKALRRP